MKKAVVTTFPLEMYDLVARDMLISFDKFWPSDIELFIAFDCISSDEHSKMENELNSILTSGREFFVCNEWGQEQQKFMERTADSGDNYRFHIKKFSHKVFALAGVKNHCLQAGHEMLIWLDADVITHRPITHEILENELLPPVTDAISYLGRKDAPHSECGFVGYNLKGGGQEIIEKMMDMYTSDSILQLPGWTDCDALDHVAKPYEKKNLSQDIDGWHVWPKSPLGKYMEHKKGRRKNIQNAVSTSNLQVKTKNCLPNESIQNNVKENLKLIKTWVEYIKPHDEEVVICSAGPSLSYNDVKPWADKGVKIITVKHAIDRLKNWGIKPWACVLLDPRPHVEGFIKRPDKDVIYFVASMVDPSVVKTLLDHDCKVVGYHALVGAGEDKVLENGTMMISGGSGTATRCIGLLHECLGFNKIHCYGYDLCYPKKPDFHERLENGDSKYLEVTLSTYTWGGKQTERTFWTEGQFLAQMKELRDLYKSDQTFKLYVYGPGMAAWEYENLLQYKAWVDKYNVDVEAKKARSPSLSDWENGIRR